MTIDVSLNQLVNLQNENTAVTQINQNSNLITTAFSSALDTTGDQMQGTLDMNSNEMINLPSPGTANSPLRLSDLVNFQGGGTVIFPTVVGGTNINVPATTNATYTISTITSPVFTSVSTTTLTTGTASIGVANVTTVNATTINAFGNITATGFVESGNGAVVLGSGGNIAATGSFTTSGSVASITGNVSGVTGIFTTLTSSSIRINATTAASTQLGVYNLYSPSSAITSFPATTINFVMVGPQGSPFNMANVGYAASGLYTFYRAQGTATTPSSVTSGNFLGGFNFSGYNGTTWVTNNPARVLAIVTDATGWTATTNGTGIEFDTTPTSSVTRAQAMRLGAGLYVGSATTDPGAGNVQAGGAFILPNYTVTTLPSGVTGMIVMVTDASATTLLGTLTGGGTVKLIGLYSGATWLGI